MAAAAAPFAAAAAAFHEAKKGPKGKKGGRNKDREKSRLDGKISHSQKAFLAKLLIN